MSDYMTDFRRMALGREINGLSESQAVIACNGCGTRFKSQADADKNVCCENPDIKEQWPISKINPATTGFKAHEDALRKAGWVSSSPTDRRDAFKEGDRALRSLDNGYEEWVIVRGFYKTSGTKVARTNGEIVRMGQSVWKKASDI
jgi:hypothetical protein